MNLESNAMKKNLFILFAFAGLLSTACVKNVNPEQGTKEPVFSLFVNGLETKADTKAGYKDGIGVIWSNIGDTEVETPIGLISAENHYQSSSVSVFDKDGVSNEQGYRVSFGFTEAPADGQYFAYQPYNSTSLNNAIKFTVEANQRQLYAGTMDVYGGSRLPCISTSKVTINDSETSNETSFKATAAILRFFVYDTTIPAGAIEKIISVKFIAKSSVAGTFTCENDGTKIGEITNGSNEVKVVLNNLADIKNNVSTPEGMGIYLVALPCTTSGYTYEVETTAGTYKFTSTSDKTLEAGYIYDVKLNLSNSKAEYTSKPIYIVGAATLVGWNTGHDEYILRQSSEDKYTLEGNFYLKESKKFRFLSDYTYFGNGYGANEAKLKLYDSDSDTSFDSEKTPGNYLVSANVRTGDLSLTKTTEKDNCDAFYVVGGWFEPAWSLANNDNLAMLKDYQTDGNWVYRWVGKPIKNNPDLTFKIRVKNTDNWDNGWYVSETWVDGGNTMFLNGPWWGIIEKVNGIGDNKWTFCDENQYPYSKYGDENYIPSVCLDIKVNGETIPQGIKFRKL